MQHNCTGASFSNYTCCTRPGNTTHNDKCWKRAPNVATTASITSTAGPPIKTGAPPLHCSKFSVPFEWNSEKLLQPLMPDVEPMQNVLTREEPGTLYKVEQWQILPAILATNTAFKSTSTTIARRQQQLVLTKIHATLWIDKGKTQFVLKKTLLVKRVKKFEASVNAELQSCKSCFLNNYCCWKLWVTTKSAALNSHTQFVIENRTMHRFQGVSRLYFQSTTAAMTPTCNTEWICDGHIQTTSLDRKKQVHSALKADIGFCTSCARRRCWFWPLGWRAGKLHTAEAQDTGTDAGARRTSQEQSVAASRAPLRCSHLLC